MHDGTGKITEARDTLRSRREIEGCIAEGKTIVIVNQMVLRLDQWLEWHPGGHKPIQHMVGRDATDEVTVLHSPETLQRLRRFQIGRIAGRWENFIPPVQGGHFRRYVPGVENGEGKDVSRSNDGAGQNITAECLFDVAHSSPRPRPVSHGKNQSYREGKDGMAFIDSQTQQELELELSKYPAVDVAIQDDIVEKYRRMHDEIKARGLYQCNYVAYLWEAARCSSLFAVMLFLLGRGWYGTSGAFLGLFWSQLVFAAHDAGHMGITHNYTVDTLIAMTIAAPLGGLSMGWWKRTHNVHHVVTNSPEHDPDNQHLPIFAVNHRFLGSLFSTYHERPMLYDAAARFLVPYQAWLYYPVLALGRFNLYAQSWIFLAQGQGPRKGEARWHRWFEIAGMAVFWYWFGWRIVRCSIPTGWGRFAFVAVSHLINMPLHAQFALSHFAMSKADLGPRESFAQKMLRTTMDVDCPPWLDFYHGGLQFQAVHHLYPRVPRHNLRAVQKMVIEFCQDVGIPYALYGFVDGNKKVVSSLAEVSRQAAILAKCQRAVAESGNFLHEH
ncbi:fatty acid desaturase [Xylariales sp. PMI_506]|nr:fatty acid desaturase [Xylariales sp. PMI_506]